MSETTGPLGDYRVSYTEYVRIELKKLIDRAKERGLESQVIAAASAIDRRLHEYPQFGEPLRDLLLESSRLWVGVIAPLVVKYAIYEEQRLVIVATRIATLPRSGLD